MNTICLIVAGALGLFFGHPNTVCHLPAAVLLCPAACTILGRRAASRGEGFRSGWFIGFFGLSAVLYWIAVPVHDFGMLPWILAVPVVLSVASVLALFFGVFSWFAYECRIRRFLPWASAVLGGIAWYLLEWIRGWILTGFPWAPLSAAFVPWPAWIQGASFVGAYALSGIFAGAASYAVFGKKQTVAALSFLAAIVALGYAGLSALPIRAAGDPVHVILTQGNIPQNIKWDASMRHAAAERYIDLSHSALMRAVPGQPVLTVWPETALAFDLEQHVEFIDMLGDFSRSYNTALIVGAVGRYSDTGKYLNRAYLIDGVGESFFGPAPGTSIKAKNGTITHIAWAEKEHLVPFGEYVPPFLDFSFLDVFFRDIGSFTVGRATKPLPQNNLHSQLVSGVLICYESIFPEIARDRVRDGATLLVNISNDAWFGRTSAPRQHLYAAAMRAVELARPLIRSTNTGISAFIDAKGRIVSQTPLFVPTVLTGSADPVTEKSVFFMLAPYLPCIALICFIMVWGLSPRRQE